MIKAETAGFEQSVRTRAHVGRRKKRIVWLVPKIFLKVANPVLSDLAKLLPDREEVGPIASRELGVDFRRMVLDLTCDHINVLKLKAADGTIPSACQHNESEDSSVAQLNIGAVGHLRQDVLQLFQARHGLKGARPGGAGFFRARLKVVGINGR